MAREERTDILRIPVRCRALCRDRETQIRIRLSFRLEEAQWSVVAGE